MEPVIFTAIRHGSTAFIGSRVTKALGQKEISELIGGSGWLIVWITMLGPEFETFKEITNFFNGCAAVIEAISSFFSWG